MLFSLFILAFLPISFAVFPQDEIIFSDLGQSFYLKNETYVFQLLPGPLVPLNIINHIIYTGSKAEITTLIKRTLFEKRHQLLDFSEEHHDHLARLLYENDVGKVPTYVKRNQMKRSVGMMSGGVVVIPLTKEGYSLFLYHPEELRGQRKRQVQDEGSSFCLYQILTICSNDDSTTDVKNALQGATTEMWAELDSTMTTNNQRALSLANTLESQKDILNSLISIFKKDESSVSTLITKVAEQESINAVNMAFGDQVVQAQIDYLKRTVNALLRYTKALAGTDPRQVVAQPSLTDLFTSYLSVLQYYTTSGFIPIVENNTFNWTEYPLPQDVVYNTAYPPLSYILWDTSQPGSSLSYPGFQVRIQLTCTLRQVMDKTQCDNDTNYISYCACDSQYPSSFFASTYGFFYGPIPLNMVGIFTMMLHGDPIYPAINMVESVYDGTGLTLSDWTTTNQNPMVWYCVQFGPYMGLATFTDTPYMMNGIPLDTLPLNITECNAMRLRSTPQSVTNTIYSMYVIYGNVLIPFFSNCTAERLITGNFTTSIQSLGYLSQYPSGYNFSDSNSETYPIPSNIDFRLNTDVFQYHMISSDCSINLEPEWIGMEYWFNSVDTVIANIPTGFKLNQFTINPVGELSSSLEFVYTSSWVTTYYIQRISENRIITDEIDLLDGDQLLFLVSENRSFVIDESNNFYGPGNNGRDCIQKAETYLYDLTSCIFQNNLVDYDANNYFKGLVQTSGIARYVNKFDFKVNTNNQMDYTFSLIPDDDADFNFYFQPDGTICPRLLYRNSDVSGCTFTFGFNGTGVPQFNNQPLSFVKEEATVDVGFGLYSLTIGNPPQDCMLVDCEFSAQYSTISLEPPPYTIISASDLALQTQVYDAIDYNLNGALSNLQNVSLSANALVPQFKNLSKKLNELNFNVSVLYPYQNFTKEREQVSAMINNLSSESAQESWTLSTSCESIFSGVDCFFKNIGGVIMTILIIVAVIVGTYCVCCKMGVFKIIVKKLFG